MPPPEVVPCGCRFVAGEAVERQPAHPCVVLVQLRQIALVPIAPHAAREAPAPRQRGLLMRRDLVGGPYRLAPRIVAAVEALQAHEYGRPQLFVAASHPVIRAVPGVLDREWGDDVRGMRV